jgi:hypothetical protein
MQAILSVTREITQLGISVSWVPILCEFGVQQPVSVKPVRSPFLQAWAGEQTNFTSQLWNISSILSRPSNPDKSRQTPPSPPRVVACQQEATVLHQQEQGGGTIIVLIHQRCHSLALH